MASTVTDSGNITMARPATTSCAARLKLLPWSLVIVLCGLAAYCLVKYTTLKLRVAYADGQVRVFEDIKESVDMMADPRELAGQLEYVVNYYPSGTKQVTGMQLDRMVETVRSHTIAAIIARLRVSTGRDLGNSPDKWLKEFPPNPN